MDDLDRLFALVGLVSDPKTAKKNAEDMKALKAQRTENSNLLKEANAVKYETSKERDRLQAAWSDLNDAKAAVGQAKSDIEAEKKNIEKMRVDANNEISRRKDEFRKVENAHNEKVAELLNRIKAEDEKYRLAVKKREDAEAELAKVRKMVGA